MRIGDRWEQSTEVSDFSLARVLNRAVIKKSTREIRNDPSKHQTSETELTHRLLLIAARDKHVLITQITLIMRFNNKHVKVINTEKWHFVFVFTDAY